MTPPPPYCQYSQGTWSMMSAGKNILGPQGACICASPDDPAILLFVEIVQPIHDLFPGKVDVAHLAMLICAILRRENTASHASRVYQ